MTLLIFLSTKSLYNLWHLEGVWASFDGILDLEKLEGFDFSGASCSYSQALLTTKLDLGKAGF